MVQLVGQHVGQYCSDPDCQDHDDLPPGAKPFADFGYTVGLFDMFRLPEVHLSAYPDGDGIPMQPQLLNDTINQIAADLIRGNLEPGGQVRVPLCEHRSVVFDLGEPGPLEAVSAYRCTDGAECIPARWRVEQTLP
jgi:hypothetical protein